MLSGYVKKMAEIFESIPMIVVILFVLGLVGVMVYEKTRSNSEK